MKQRGSEVCLASFSIPTSNLKDGMVPVCNTDNTARLIEDKQRMNGIIYLQVPRLRRAEDYSSIFMRDVLCTV
jgi:hypothetical protein